MAFRDKKMPPRPDGAHVYMSSSRTSDDLVWKYKVPCYLTFDFDKCNEFRLSAIRRRDEMLAFQKEFGAARDADGARWFKAEATDALKDYRAACLMIGFCWPGAFGDTPYKPMWEWPVEIARHLDRVVRACEAI